MSTPAWTSLAERISAIEVHFILLHFILLHFRLEDITTGSVHSRKDFASSGEAANGEIIAKMKG